jgi:hypothetical protein
LMALVNFAPSAPSTMRWSHESVSFIIWRTTIACHIIPFPAGRLLEAGSRQIHKRF